MTRCKAMILAAGRGKRLRPLTDHTPKPLVPLAGKPLIAYHLESLARVGIKEVVINVAYKAQLIQKTLGTGEKYGVNIHYSVEPEENGLETGGGIFQALPLLNEESFIVINSDIWTDYPLQNLLKPMDNLSHLVLVNNPAHHPHGDFGLADNKVLLDDDNLLTFAGINLYSPKLFENCQPGFFSVVPLLKEAMQNHQVSGEHYSGNWIDIGSLDRLIQAETLLIGQN